MTLYIATILPIQLPDGSWTEAEPHEYESTIGPIAWSGMNPPTEHRVVPDNAVATQVMNLPQPVYGGRRDLTHFEFRQLFPGDQRKACDAFEVAYETDGRLTEDQKDDIRTGLKDFYAALNVSLDNPKIPALLGVYAQLGIIPQSLIAEVLRG